MFGRSKSRTGASRSPMKSSSRSSSRDENTAPTARPQLSPQKRASLKDIYYEEHKLTDDEIKKRHERLGYDPLDKLIQSERIALNEKKSAWTSKRDRVGKTQKQLEEMHKKEYRDRVRTLLREHIETMAELGIVFHHTFRKDRLGFQILIARYGEEGREYIHVEETMPHSEVWPGPLKPTDELIAVNGKVIMEPSQDRFKDLQKAILRCPRPLKLTFIHGERRDEAFAEQEERRAMRGEDKVVRTSVLDARAACLAAARAAAARSQTASRCATNAGFGSLANAPPIFSPAACVISPADVFVRRPPSLRA
mmetsp:Transcript_9368/g.29208  ORF Transcript_9368/g.29208 Transcript_9368/m.29208 type:complete len:309 (+) Transcript_9368:115-1041(+)